MLNVKLERYLNTFWRKDEAKSFASLSELENWIFDQMQQDYSRNTWAMSFPTPASARNIHADGPWAIKFQPIPGETTISIHQIESSERHHFFRWPSYSRKEILDRRGSGMAHAL